VQCGRKDPCCPKINRLAIDVLNDQVLPIVTETPAPPSISQPDRESPRNNGMNAASNVATMSVTGKYPHLSNAPIVEAVVDWRAKLPIDFDIEKFKGVANALGPRYKLSDEERGFEFGVKFKYQPGDQPQVSSREVGIQGFRFQSEDGLEIANLQQNGFSFSRLKPYTQWDSVFDEAERLWNVYRAVCQPEEISRIAVRYINRIPLPLPVTDFGVYFTVPPVVPPGLPPLISALLYRVVLNEPASGILTNVTQVLEVPDGGCLPFILDIDAYITKNMDPGDPGIRSHFAALREMKNRAFFGTLTKTTIEMFQ
jgi:uncharacterized protein (TIGR04255 family)